MSVESWTSSSTPVVAAWNVRRITASRVRRRTSQESRMVTVYARALMSASVWSA